MIAEPARILLVDACRHAAGDLKPAEIEEILTDIKEGRLKASDEETTAMAVLSQKMEPKQFENWIKSMDWTILEVATAFRLEESTIESYLSGEVEMPCYVNIACVALSEVSEKIG